VRCYALALATLGAGSLLFAWRSELAHAVHWLPHARVAVLWLGAAIATAALAITGAVTPARWPAVIVVCGLGLELLYAAREMEYNRTATSDLYAEPAAVAHFIEAVERPGAELPAARTLSLAVEERLDVDRLRRSAPDRSADDLHYAAMRDAVRPNLGTVYGLPTIDGYDGGMLPLKTYSDFKSLLIANETPVPHFTLAPQASARPDSRLLAALGVRFLLLDGRAGAPGAGWSAREDAPGAAWLYENQERFSRAWLVGDVRAEPDPQRTLALLRGMDLRSAAVIERPVAELAGGTPITSVGAPNAAHVARYGAGIAEIEADGPGLLVLTESYYPGWHATVDGKSAPLVRADLVFHGVPLPAGAHRVRVWYDPLSIKVGIAVSVLALVLNVGLAWRARGPRRLPP